MIDCHNFFSQRVTACVKSKACSSAYMTACCCFTQKVAKRLFQLHIGFGLLLFQIKVVGGGGGGGLPLLPGAMGRFHPGQVAGWNLTPPTETFSTNPNMFLWYPPKARLHLFQYWWCWHTLHCLNSHFHFSCLYFIPQIFSAAAWCTNNSSSESSPQTSCTTCFWHYPTHRVPEFAPEAGSIPLVCQSFLRVSLLASISGW